MTTRKRIHGTEAALSRVWSGAAGARLRTESGENVRVLYPGRRPGSAGPDYRDAVLDFEEEGVVRGDVELHVTPVDWRRHGHAGDAAYANVILHAVGRGDGSSVTATPGGGVAQVLVLARRSGRGLPCAGACGRSASTVLAVLRLAGIERLRSRAAAMARQCAEYGPGVVLLRGIARALGYTANADAGQRLGGLLAAEAVPGVLRAAAEVERRAYGLGVAGLLPSQRGCVAGMRGEDEVSALESAWRGAAGTLPSMPASSWRLNGVYVNNSPLRRIVALMELLPRLDGLAESMRSDVSRAAAAGRPTAGSLESRLLVRGDAYWRCRYDFGCRTRESDLLGSAKAREVVVNALLPHLLAVATLERDEDLLRGTMQTYAAYPSLRGNSVTGHMRHQLGLPTGALPAAVDQGLVHLYAEFCRHGLCSACPLSR